MACSCTASLLVHDAACMKIEWIRFKVVFLSCLVLSCLVLSCLALPCPALPCPALSCPALPCPALPCPALPCLLLPFQGECTDKDKCKCRLKYIPVSTAPMLQLCCTDYHAFGLACVFVSASASAASRHLSPSRYSPGVTCPSWYGLHSGLGVQACPPVTCAA